MSHGIVKRMLAFKMDRTQATIILCGTYIFFALAGNVAATKVVSLGDLVMDAGFIYALTFTWRDLIHKQLGRRAALTTIWFSAGACLGAALYFQLVVLLPAEPSWSQAGGQAAWSFLFGLADAGGPWWHSIFSLQMRVVLGSIITGLIAELLDTFVYEQWAGGWGMNRPQWTRVFVSNSLSIPVDSLLFPLIAFSGIVSSETMVQMFQTNLAIKALITVLSFWTIYLVPEERIYRDR